MIKGILDWSAVLTGAGVVVKMLPAIAALWTIAWLSISIWESKTVRRWRKCGKVSQKDSVETKTAPLHVEDDDPPHGG